MDAKEITLDLNNRQKIFDLQVHVILQHNDFSNKKCSYIINNYPIAYIYLGVSSISFFHFSP